ncbi:MAG: hypothetical protein M0Q92_02950, partial [Methanoregula sp.]|nr:hypothetical protein [Methanoregula sp.]
MIDQLPEGISIGWMQAPPQWIFTHTVRFIGIVRVVIQDGEGFILIQKGKPLAYYFKHGRIELKGHAALDYFNSHPTIEFNLCKYTSEEFAEALKICNIDEEGTIIPPQQEKTVPETPLPKPTPLTPVVSAAPPVPARPAIDWTPPAAPADRNPPPPAPAPVPAPPAPKPVPAAPKPREEKPAVRNVPPAPPVIPPQPVFASPTSAVPSPVIPRH